MGISNRKEIARRMKGLEDSVLRENAKSIGQIGLVALKNRFGAHAVPVLSDYIRERDREKRGERRSYDIIKELPSTEVYKELLDKKYTITLDQLLSDALGEIESLKDEIQEWYDNLPEAFQQNDKGEQLQECIDQFDSLSLPSVPGEKDIEHKLLLDEVIFLPAKHGSRSERLAEAVRKLEFVAEFIENKDELDHLREQIEDLVSECEIDFPGMY